MDFNTDVTCVQMLRYTPCPWSSLLNSMLALSSVLASLMWCSLGSISFVWGMNAFRLQLYVDRHAYGYTCIITYLCQLMIKLIWHSKSVEEVEDLLGSLFLLYAWWCELGGASGSRVSNLNGEVALTFGANTACDSLWCQSKGPEEEECPGSKSFQLVKLPPLLSGRNLQ